MDSLRASSQTQEQRIEILENFQENSEDFIQDTIRIDNNVADTVDQNKDDFYDKYDYHMPAKKSSHLSENEGPAIRMEKSDHRQTASCGRSKEAAAYRAKQQELINNGQFRDAVQMDINDLQSKFGAKYAQGISELLDYVDMLEKGGKI